MEKKQIEKKIIDVLDAYKLGEMPKEIAIKNIFNCFYNDDIDFDKLKNETDRVKKKILKKIRDNGGEVLLG